MPDFFVGNIKTSLLDIDKVSIYFRTKQCSGQPGSSVPISYISTSAVDATGDLTEVMHDTALAYFNPGSADPINKVTLDKLTEVFTDSYIAWRRITFDYVFSGICKIVPSGLVDTYEFNYSSVNDICSTRIYTYPFNYTVQELGHFDYPNDCEVATDTGLLNWDAGPFISYYGPPGICVTATSTATATAQGCGSLQLARFGFMEQDGRLVRKFFQYDLISSP